MRIPVGTARTRKVRYAAESADGSELLKDEAGNLRYVEVPITERDWNVTDSDQRYRAAVEEIGEFDEAYGETCLQWMIDEERNAAGLCVFRHRVAA